MRVVITGRNGQVVRSLVERGSAKAFEIVPLGRPQLDLSGESRAISAAIEAARPQVIVSAAAYTAVDNAEIEPALTYAINRDGAAAVAAAAYKLGVPLIHISTDYVFDGSSPRPYVEEDLTGALSVYGASKLAGEQAILQAHNNVVILRTAWVYSPFGTNFVKTMLRLARSRDEVSVVDDQLGNPTSALDIADAILAVAANLTDSDLEQRGIFHMTATGDATWAQFAEALFSASAAAGGPHARVQPITTADFPTLAPRPANSRLDSGKLARLHGVRLPDWRRSTARVVTRLLHGPQ